MALPAADSTGLALRRAGLDEATAARAAEIIDRALSDLAADLAVVTSETDERSHRRPSKATLDTLPGEVARVASSTLARHLQRRLRP